MLKSIPIFKSHHSIGKSILTLEKRGSSLPNGPDSIIDIAVEEGLKEVILIDSSYSGQIEAAQNLAKENIKLFFGIEMQAVENAEDKTEESIKTEHRINVLALDNVGEKLLKKIYSRAFSEGFYYKPRIDLKYLRDNWISNLLLWIPFYDSYIYQNVNGANCTPNFGKIPLSYLYEDNYLPIDTVIQDEIKDKNLIKAKTIFYKKRSDFTAYLAFRCIQNRSTIERPELNGLSSEEFCIESWKEQNAS